MKPQTMVDLDFVVLPVLDKWAKPSYLTLHAGEMTKQEIRSVLAVLKAIRAELTQSLSRHQL